MKIDINLFENFQDLHNVVVIGIDIIKDKVY